MASTITPKLSYRGLVLNLFKKIQAGQLNLHDANETLQFGDNHPPEVTANLTVCNPLFYRMLVQQGSLGAAEAYLKGYWTTTDLLNLFTFFMHNNAVLNDADNGLSKITGKLRDLFNFLKSNTKKRSQQYISYHYDLSNDFFQLFLDKAHQQYSSAIYPYPEASLEDAQTYKLKVIAEKLQLKSTDHLLEIGTGWGGLCIFMAKNYGCKVTTTTISKAQHDYAKARIKAEGLEDKITLLFKDYRNLTGLYDKLVSIEMLEAVGHQYYSSYFSQCNRLLKKNALALIQVITINEQTYQKAKTSVDFIKRYIFPGGCLPSITAIMQTCTKETQLNLIQLSDLGLDYAKTLTDWRSRFWKQIDAVKQLGFDDRFIRMWDYYYCYCISGFKSRYISDVHLLFQKYVY